MNDPNAPIKLPPYVDFRGPESRPEPEPQPTREPGVLRYLLLAFVLWASLYAWQAKAGTALYVGESPNQQTTLCVYERFGEVYTINVRKPYPCPVSIEVDEDEVYDYYDPEDDE